MSSPYSPPRAVVTDNSKDDAFLVKDLTLLMAALRLNNSDDWAGKPQQETFRVYETMPPVATAQPSPCSADVGDAARGSSPHDSDKSDASSDSLSTLMTGYVHAVRALHAFDAQMAADGIRESATAEAGHTGGGVVGAEEEATTPCKAAADDGSSSAANTKRAEAAAPVDMAELLAAPDLLPFVAAAWSRSPTMPPLFPAGQRQPTLLNRLASATPTRKAAALPNSTTSLSSTANSVRCSSPGLPSSSTAATISSSKESLSLLNRLLFGADGRRGADLSSPRSPPPAVSPASLGIATPASAAATASGAEPPRPRRGRPPPHLKQTTLDLGQAEPTMATRCPLCRMLYTAENDEDAALHRRFCREGQLRRRGRGPYDAPSSFTGACRSQRARTETAASPLASLSRPAAVAVRMLEELSGASLGHSPSPLLGSTTATVRRGGPRRREIGARGFAKATYTATETRNTAADATVSLCTCVLCPRSSLSSPPHLSSPLAVFCISLNACGVADSNGGCTALRLLELLDFTPVVLRAAAEGVADPQTASSSVLRGSVPAAPTVRGSAASTVYVVCVVDTVLRLLLCAVVGEPRRREQDPELCVERRADGATVCSTRRHFTHGDVAGLWVLSPAELSAAQKAWEKSTAAPFASTRQMLESFFGTRAGGGAPSSAQSSAAHVTEKAHERCQQAAGVALHALAQYLVYGSSLCPSRQLSYSQAALAAAEHLGTGFMEQCLATAAAASS
ncbi:zinc-finger of acetyl-transferase ESCO family protein [Leishmania donovani]|uniref:Zinc-finger of acetyl-transferase ESCO family protein n=1 Tax=Leishmania donovani TaxID=5661 RepID=A0A504Y1C5_LEIDO|nr:zinc-finger of acetyl-transferase ESCO family protein [Leishmania donovani]